MKQKVGALGAVLTLAALTAASFLPLGIAYHFGKKAGENKCLKSK